PRGAPGGWSRGALRDAGHPVTPLAAKVAASLTPSRRSLLESVSAGLYSQAALVATGIIVARTLGPTDRGYFAFLLLLESVVRQLGALGLPAALTYFLARNPDRERAVLRAV